MSYSCNSRTCCDTTSVQMSLVTTSRRWLQSILQRTDFMCFTTVQTIKEPKISFWLAVWTQLMRTTGKLWVNRRDKRFFIKMWSSNYHFFYLWFNLIMINMQLLTLHLKIILAALRHHHWTSGSVSDLSLESCNTFTFILLFLLHSPSASHSRWGRAP